MVFIIFMKLFNNQPSFTSKYRVEGDFVDLAKLKLFVNSKINKNTSIEAGRKKFDYIPISQSINSQTWLFCFKNDAKKLNDYYQKYELKLTNEEMQEALLKLDFTEKTFQAPKAQEILKFNKKLNEYLPKFNETMQINAKEALDAFKNGCFDFVNGIIKPKK